MKKSTNTILQPRTNAEFKKTLDDMSELFNPPNEYELPVIEQTVKKEVPSVDKFDKKLFGTRLKSILKSRKITQEEFAKKLGSKRQTIGNYVNGIRLPNINVVYDMAKILGVSADYLLGIETDSVKATQEMLVKQAQNELLDKIIAFCTELKQ